MTSIQVALTILTKYLHDAIRFFNDADTSKYPDSYWIVCLHCNNLILNILPVQKYIARMLLNILFFKDNYLKLLVRIYCISPWYAGTPTHRQCSASKANRNTYE